MSDILLSNLKAAFHYAIAFARFIGQGESAQVKGWEENLSGLTNGEFLCVVKNDPPPLLKRLQDASDPLALEAAAEIQRLQQLLSPKPPANSLKIGTAEAVPEKFPTLDEVTPEQWRSWDKDKRERFWDYQIRRGHNSTVCSACDFPLYPMQQKCDVCGTQQRGHR